MNFKVNLKVVRSTSFIDNYRNSEVNLANRIGVFPDIQIIEELYMYKSIFSRGGLGLEVVVKKVKKGVIRLFPK